MCSCKCDATIVMQGYVEKKNYWKITEENDCVIFIFLQSVNSICIRTMDLIYVEVFIYARNTFIRK